MNNDIQIRVSACSECALFANRQTREPLFPHDILKLPWRTIAMDILEFQNKNFLVVVDCMSHFRELRMMNGKTAEHVVMPLKSIFAVHGAPHSIMADNMPFGSHRMREFAREWSFNVVTSSPHHHQSNGIAERDVKTIKQFLKCEMSGEDVYRSLQIYQDTPLSGCFYSPAEMLFSRRLRTGLPIAGACLAPGVVLADDTLHARQRRAKTYHD